MHACSFRFSFPSNISSQPWHSVVVNYDLDCYPNADKVSSYADSKSKGHPLWKLEDENRSVIGEDEVREGPFQNLCCKPHSWLWKMDVTVWVPSLESEPCSYSITKGLICKSWAKTSIRVPSTSHIRTWVIKRHSKRVKFNRNPIFISILF